MISVHLEYILYQFDFLLKMTYCFIAQGYGLIIIHRYSSKQMCWQSEVIIDK